MWVRVGRMVCAAFFWEKDGQGARAAVRAAPLAQLAYELAVYIRP